MSAVAFPGSWLNMVSFAAPAPFVTVSTSDGSLVSGVVGATSSMLSFPAGTAGVLTADASGLGSTLRMRQAVRTTVGALVTSAAASAGVSSSSLTRGLSWTHLDSLSISANLSAAVYSATLSGSPTSVALAAASGGLSFGLRLASSATLAGGVTAEVEVVVALLGSGGLSPGLAALLASGSPGDIAKAMASSAVSQAQGAASAAVDSAANAAADKVDKVVSCVIDAAAPASSGGPTSKVRAKGSLACVPRPPRKASAKAALSRALAKAKSAAKGAAASVLASAGSAPQWQPVAWAGASMRVSSLGGVFDALGASVPGLDIVTGFLGGFLPPGEMTAVVALGSDDADLAQLPADITPDALAILGAGTSVTKGLIVQVAVAPPAACGGGAGALLCQLVKMLVTKDRPLRFKMPVPTDMAGLTASIEVDDIPLSSKVTLQSVALTATAEPPSVGIAASISLAVQGGNFLLLSASISEGPGVLNLAASMMGVWQGAFGWKQLDVSNLALSTSITMTIPPVPKAFMFQGSAAAYAPGTAHDGCAPGGIAASAQRCIACTVAVGYEAVPPTAWFYASLTSVELGAGLSIGDLPCIFAGACLGPSDPLYGVLHAVSITAATISSADMPQALLDGTPVPAGFSFAGAASICGLVDVALSINIDAKSGSAAVAAAASSPSVALAFAGGFAGSDPAASYFYAGFSVHLNVPKVLCQLGKLCSLPADVRAMLGSGALDISLAVSRAGAARTIALQGSPVTISIPKGFHLALALNFFDFMRADAEFSIADNGAASASIALGAIEFGGILLCRTSTDCSAGPRFAASLSSPASASLQAYARLFNIATFSVNAVIAEDHQSVSAAGIGMMGMRWATEVAMTGRLGRPTAISMALTLTPSDLSKIEREVIGFLNEILEEAEKAFKKVGAAAKKAGRKIASGASKAGHDIARGASKAGRSIGRSVSKAFGRHRHHHRFMGADAAMEAEAGADVDTHVEAEAEAGADADVHAEAGADVDAEDAAGVDDFAVEEAAGAAAAVEEEEAGAGAAAGMEGDKDDEAAASVGALIETLAGTEVAAARRRAAFALRSISAKMDIEAKHVKGGFDPSATVQLSVRFMLSGKVRAAGRRRGESGGRRGACVRARATAANSTPSARQRAV